MGLVHDADLFTCQQQVPHAGRQQTRDFFYPWQLIVISGKTYNTSVSLQRLKMTNNCWWQWIWASDDNMWCWKLNECISQFVKTHDDIFCNKVIDQLWKVTVAINLLITDCCMLIQHFVFVESTSQLCQHLATGSVSGSSRFSTSCKHAALWETLSLNHFKLHHFH